MKPYILLILVLQITISRAASLPFNYIFRNVPTDTEFYGLVKKVERNVKTYSIDFNPSLKDASLKDSLRSLFYSFHETINERVWSALTCDLELMKGILWHYLYMLDVDSAFEKSDKIFSSMMKQFPKRFECAWLKGVHLSKSSKFKEGFSILDSIHSNVSIDDDLFITYYAKVAAYSFLPLDMHGFNKPLQILYNSNNINRELLENNENIPVSESWNTISSYTPKEEVPIFVFGAHYEFYKPVRLSFPPYQSLKNSKKNLVISKRFAEQHNGPLFFEPNTPPLDMGIKIFVNCGNITMPLKDYVFSLTYRSYDRIWEEKILKKINGISVRCHNKSIYKNKKGTYYAFTAFDTINGTRKLNTNDSIYAYNEKPDVKPDKVRYLIAMKTDLAVKDKAEAKYQEILQKFGLYQ